MAGRKISLLLIACSFVLGYTIKNFEKYIRINPDRFATRKVQSLSTFNNTAPLQQMQHDSTYSSKVLSKLIQERVCTQGGVWAKLCQEDFVYALDQLIQRPNPNNQPRSRVVQIGAHVGFEPNDPLGSGILQYLNLMPNEHRKHFQWSFVEPSTANFRSLQKNLDSHADLGANLQAIQAGVVSDSTQNLTDMTFYSIRDTIDPVTGVDSLSGKTFPRWITQISSFSMAPIRFNRRVWTQLGLNMMDYVVEQKVTTKRYSDLMKELVFQGDTSDASSLLLVLIDTEGFDCHIVNGISPNSQYLPKYLVFEHKQCSQEDLQTAMDHLESMGYTIVKLAEDVVAYKM